MITSLALGDLTDSLLYSLPSDRDWETGTTATAYIYKDEKPGCFQFYQKSYQEPDAPGTVTNNGRQVFSVDSVNSASGRTAYTNIIFPVAMFDIPAITAYSPITGASGQVNSASVDYAAIIIPSTINEKTVGQIGCTNTASTTQFDLIFHWVADIRP